MDEMEFPFDINLLLGNGITKLDNKLALTGVSDTSQSSVNYPNGTPDYRVLKRQLNEVIDKIGEASAKAQGLSGAITSGSKLGCSDHHLYMIKDPSGNGAAVGMLKMGHKRLFVYDQNGGHHEMEPLCVLDFYVHESRQRQGCGKRLFEHMIREEKVKPQHLAIDRPSHKFLSFLHKHYHLKATIPQVNNFVVFDGFLRDRTDMGGRRRRGGNSGRAPLHTYTRNESRVISGNPYEDNTSRYSSLSNHAPQQMNRQKQALDQIPIPKPSSRESLITGTMERPCSGESRVNLPECLGGAGNHGNRPSSRQSMGQCSAYSRHSASPCQSPALVPPPAASQPMEVEMNNNNLKLNNLPAVVTKKASSPPSIRRNGPSRDFVRFKKEFSPPNNDYLDRKGHLRVAPNTDNHVSLQPTNHEQSTTNYISQNSRGTPSTFSNLPTADPYSNHSAKPKQESSFNIFGVPVNTGNLTTSSRKHQHTRLW